MKNKMTRSASHTVRAQSVRAIVAVAVAAASFSPTIALSIPTLLADQPVRSSTSVPANVMLALSVEWPTGVVSAHNDLVAGCPGRDSKADSVCYVSAKTYLGYFDPYKCYSYSSASEYFQPVGYTSSASASALEAGDHSCSGNWSGNFLNWATMQTSDIFRWAMTGGDRFIDTASLSVIEKARHTGQGGFDQFPLKRIGSVSGSGTTTITPVARATVMPSSATPGSGAEVFVRVNGLNTEMWVGTNRDEIRENSRRSGTTNVFKVRVRVCDPALPESNTACTVYGSNVNGKPTGIIQENALKLRFGAFGYLLDDNELRDGGVLRARMKDVGPLKAKPGEAPVINPRAEWSPGDGVYINNPDAADASATAAAVSGAIVNFSGVIPYLNKFGRKDSYKNFDPVSEMYAESLKYFRKLAATPSYSSGLNDRMVDGFPVITDWDDPMQYACQKNFIIGIADSNTHKDKNLSGNTRRTNEPAALPAGADPGYNVVAWTDSVGNAETPPILNFGSYNNCCDGSGYLAGLAFYARTTDLRTDEPFMNNLNGPQTVSTYFVDVREAGSWGTSGDPRNQLWLAAKFGGFTDSNKDGIFQPATDAWANTGAGTVQGYPVPKNYFAASEPDRLVSGLRDAINDINALNGAGAGSGLATTNVSETSTTDGIYQAKFDTANWSGTVRGSLVASVDDATGTITRTDRWDAGAMLDTLLISANKWDTDRFIVTAVPGASPLGKPFRFINLSTAQKAALGPVAPANEREDVLKFLRGDSTFHEKTAAGIDKPGGKYRTRKSFLGDIVDSEAIFVGAPSADYIDALNPGYLAYKSSKATRKKMVYVGANDGMLHAFDGSVAASGTGGKEVFAFVPNAMYQGPSLPTATPSVDGIAALAKPSYNHRYYVNATGDARDVDFNKTVGESGASPDWRTIYVSGLGKGGRSYFALDVTDPDAFTTEANVASKVMWEFSDLDMGYTYGMPITVKTRKWGWVVILTSGYNNIHNSTLPANRGKGYLYILNAKTGVLIQKISNNVGSAADPSGFAHITGYTPSFAGYVTDEVYGGDLLGNVWRFDLKSATADIPAPLLFAKVVDDNDIPQPVTTRPFIEYNANDFKRYVFVGTGKLLDNSDTINPQAQHFYAIRDGLREQRFEASPVNAITGVALPLGATFPITKSQLAVLNKTADGLTANEVNAKPMGWRYELKGVANLTISGAAKIGRERVNLPYSAGNGVISWVGNVPELNVCNPDGFSYLYATSYGTGRSKFRQISGTGTITLLENVQSTAVVKAQLVTFKGTGRVLTTDQSGDPALKGGPLNQIGIARQLNWREVLQ